MRIPSNHCPRTLGRYTNAKIKGSRDPLAAQPIWAAFGRHVVTNLTTQSTSVRGFTTLLLGRYFAAELVDKGMANREDALDVFLRMEQHEGRFDRSWLLPAGNDSGQRAKSISRSPRLRRSPCASRPVVATTCPLMIRPIAQERLTMNEPHATAT